MPLQPLYQHRYRQRQTHHRCDGHGPLGTAEAGILDILVGDIAAEGIAVGGIASGSGRRSSPRAVAENSHLAAGILVAAGSIQPVAAGRRSSLLRRRGRD